MDDVVSKHLGSTTKTRWGDRRRQADVADVGDTEEQEVSNCRVGVSPLCVSEIGQLTEVRCVLK